MKKRKFHFPILEKRNSGFPKGFVCPWCKERRVWEPHSMVMLMCGAMAPRTGGGWGAPTKGLRGILRFTWHGAHPEDGGEGEYPNTGCGLSIADDVYGGACTITFCSVSCMRGFLNHCLDELESKIKKLKPLKKPGKIR